MVAKRKPPLTDVSTFADLGEGAGQVERKLEKYKLLFDNVTDLAYICDTEGNVLYLNRAFEKLSGHRPEEFFGRSFAPLFDGEDLEKANEFYTRTIEGESPRFEVRFRDTGVLCEYKSLPLRDEKGDIIGVIGTARDMTERSRAERELERRDRILDSVRFSSEEILSAGSLDAALDGVIARLGEATGVSRVYIFENHDGPAGELLTTQRHEWAAPGIEPQIDNPLLEGFSWAEQGFSRWVEAMSGAEVMLGHVKDFPAKEREIFTAQDIKSMVCVPVFVENRWWGFIGFDECVEEREWSAAETDALKAAASTIGAAIQRRQMEERLRTTAAKLNEAQRLAHLGSWEWDLVDDRAWWSEEYSRIFGIDRGEFDKNASDLFLGSIHPDDRDTASMVADKALSDKAPFECELRVVRGGGEMRHVLISGEVATDETGGAVKVIGTVLDITERKRAEEELSRYRATHEAIFRSVKDAIVMVDLDMVVVEVNEAAEALCGVSRSGIGQRYSDIVTACAFKCVEALGETLATENPVELSRLECHHGPNPLTVTLNTFPVFDNHGAFSGAVLVVKDETRLVGLERDLNERKRLHNIIGGSRRMQELFLLIENLADIDTTVLIIGESGTGKELVADALHYTGIRSEKPIVKVNCSALAETLLESELFGHVKGAFTGAAGDRIGRFQMADGGTIFLDEIGDISPDMQLRLLRVLQTKEFERLGDSTTIKVDVRIIAATNQDLSEKVRRGEFREDLYWRLKVVEVDIPALRERLEDLPLLEEHFMKKFNKKFGRGIGGLSTEVKRIFMDYHWPGNIRELEHALEHAFILCRHNTIGVNNLPNHLRSFSGNRHNNHRSPGVDEQGAIRDALKMSSWNKAKAARKLGMSRRTIYRKIARYGISPDEGD